MNFLAHAWLAGESPADRLGGLMGDFVKGVLPAGLPADVAEGVRLHRALDSFADTHPAFLASCARVPAARRRVAGIVVDMFYDHFLAHHWAEFDERPLEAFTAHAYALMRVHRSLLPPRLATLLPAMAGDDWLASYRDPDNVAFALDRMAKRLSRPHLLAGSGVLLDELREGFEHDFRAFMPDALEFVAAQRAARVT